jgi:hypothetical protein
MKLEQYLIDNNIEFTKDNDNITVGDSLDLRYTNITSLPDNLTVGGFLDLEATNISSLPDNLTVGGGLDLKNTNISNLPDNLTVGGSLDLEATNISNKEKAKEEVYQRNLNINWDLTLTWKNGKYRKIDGIFCEVIRELKNCLKVKVGLKTQYIVTNGTHYSHGDTIKKAKESLVYKISNRDTSVYNDYTLDTVIDKKDYIPMYRVITGACESGTRDFCENAELKDKMSIADLIEVTKGQYGNQTFKEFFNK